MKKLAAILIAGLALIPATAPAQLDGKDVGFAVSGRCERKDGAVRLVGSAHLTAKREEFIALNVVWSLWRDMDPVDGDLFVFQSRSDLRHRTDEEGTEGRFELRSGFHSPWFTGDYLRLEVRLEADADPNPGDMQRRKVVVEFRPGVGCTVEGEAVA